MELYQQIALQPGVYDRPWRQLAQTTGTFPALSDNVKKAGGKRKPRRK